MSKKRARIEYSEEGIRLKITMFLFIGAFIVVDAKLLHIQVLSHDKYSKMAQSQYTDQQTIPSQRGNILSSDGSILAGTRSNYLLYAEPNNIVEKEKLAVDLSKTLSRIMYRRQEITSADTKESTESLNNTKVSKKSEQEIFGEYYDKILADLSKDLMWIAIEKNLTPLEKEEIEQNNFKYIGFEEEPIRNYPEGRLAGHVLGFVARNEKGDPTGYYGIEGRLNDDLKGKSGKIVEETDATGVPILTGGFKKIDSLQGRNIQLTIDRAVQYIVENRLKSGVIKYEAKSGSVIVMNPYTGEILAMANYPDYEPGNINFETVYEKDAPYRKVTEITNDAISKTYEPGSVIKPFTVAAGIDLGLITPDTTFEDKGSVQYSGYTIQNWNHVAYGVQTITQLLQKSNNIGAAWVGHKVGAKRLSDYFTDFGMGSKTGIDLQGEEAGRIKKLQELTDIDLANMSFGQGMASTPLQVLNAMNVLANGGNLLQPKIISRVYDDEKSTEIPTKVVRRVIKEETAKTMVPLLEQTARGGEANFFVKTILSDYKIAGKTGTAQIPIPGGYDDKRTNATFVGFLSGDKRISMIVKLEEPKTSTYASETAVPLWLDIITDLVKYYGIAPDIAVEPTPVQSEF